MSVQTYTVEGMTCDHCAAAVDRELRTLPGIAATTVDVAAGAVTVTTAEPAPTDEAIAAAVEEAGYTLVGRA